MAKVNIYLLKHHNIISIFFLPYLNVADQIYLKQLRKEYTGRNYILDAGLAISFNEVADRLIFWEKYLKQYPRSYFISQVKELIRAYRSALFEER